MEDRGQPDCPVRWPPCSDIDGDVKAWGLVQVEDRAAENRDVPLCQKDVQRDADLQTQRGPESQAGSEALNTRTRRAGCIAQPD